MLLWLLVTTAATAAFEAAVALDKDALMLALDNGTRLSFVACRTGPSNPIGLLTAPTFGDEAFSVTWQPEAGGSRHQLVFSQPQLGRLKACRLQTIQLDQHRGTGEIRLSAKLSGSHGNRDRIEIEFSTGSSNSQSGECKFEASASGSAGSAGHLLAVPAFDGCVQDQTVWGGRHCFGGWSEAACAAAEAPRPGALSRAKRAATCSPGDCKNGGICNNVTASPVCICPLPFIPPYCAAVSNYCTQLQPDINITSLPVCVNNSTCVGVTLTPPYFNCSCAPGYEGVRCEKEINECAQNPCGANGQCQDLLNNYSCSCFPGWEGRNCSHNIDDCNTTICPVRERCVDGNSTCSCASGWLGAICSSVDFCVRGSCPNGTACVNLSPQAFECRSAATFAYGRQSPIAVSPWRLTPSGGLAEPLSAAVGRVRVRLANSSTASPPLLLTVNRQDRRLSLGLTPSGHLVASLDNLTATLTSLSIATGEDFWFNLTAEPSYPLSLTVARPGNSSQVWAAASSETLPNSSSLILDSVAIVTLGDGFKGCLEGLRINGRLLPLSNWSLPAGQPGFVRYVDWPANKSAPPGPLIGCQGDPVCELDPQPACLNSGRCVDLWNHRECACTPGYSGPACGTADCSLVPCAVALAGVSTPVVVTLCVLALLIVVVIIVVVLFKLARGRRSETGQYRPSKEETNHDRPNLSVREPDPELDDNFVLGNTQVARL